MKKQILSIVLSALLICTSICGCSNTDEANTLKNENSSMISQIKNDIGSDNKNGTTEIKVTELFNSNERRIWFFLNKLGYNENIREICIVKNGCADIYYEQSSIGYTNLRITFDEINGMTDDEIIAYLDSIDRIDKKSGITLNFSYKRDTSGNKLGKEIIDGFEYYPKCFIDSVLKPTTILSNQMFGFEVTSSGRNVYLITKYDFDNDTKIILNDISDDGIEDYNK